MGMFDEVRCAYPLPWPEVQDSVWQSKYTPAQFLDQYEIRADGTLWHEAYTQRVEESDDAPAGFWIHRENAKWEQVAFTGELEMHELTDDYWYSVRWWFVDGKVKDRVCRKTRNE